MLISVTNEKGWNVFHVAAEQGHLRVIQLIYEHIVTVWSAQKIKDFVNAQDSNGFTPLHLACRPGNVDLMQYLLDTVKVNIWLKDREDKLAFHYAFDCEHHQIARKLIEMTHSKTNLLHHAVSYGDINAVKMVHQETIKMWSDSPEKIKEFVNAKDSNGRTALHIACFKGPVHDRFSSLLALLCRLVLLWRTG